MVKYSWFLDLMSRKIACCQKGLRYIQIAIDGPAGAGKSTIARQLAERLGYLYIDTGAMYRAVTWLALEKGISVDDPRAMTELASQASIDLVRTPEGIQKVFCNGQDVTEAIRDPLVSQHVSLAASHEGVRNQLVKKQQEMACNQSVVMDGRDIGTVVLPQAHCKVFLTASLEERTRRRYLELREKGYREDMACLQEEMAARDRLDRNREIGPLCAAPDAHIIDTTRLNREEVLERLMQICCEKRKDL